jgi:hypothetical protein
LIGFHHLRHYPGAILSFPGALCAGLNNLIEGAIKAQFKIRLCRISTECFAKRAVQLKVANLEHHSGVWAPPQDGLVRVVPRKNSLGVGLKQAIDP